MAMESPGTWVVGFKPDNDEATNGEEDDIAAGWIIEFRIESCVAISFIRLLEEGKVVTVEMHLFVFKGINFIAREQSYVRRKGRKGARVDLQDGQPQQRLGLYLLAPLEGTMW